MNENGIIESLNEIPSIKFYISRLLSETNYEIVVKGIRKIVVVDLKGKYSTDIATIYFYPDGCYKVKGDVEYSPNESESDAFKAEFKNYRFPRTIRISSTRNTNLPTQIAQAEKDNVFEFLDEDGKIIMLQVRIDDDKGGKSYVPWTYWDDHKWRCLEPDTEYLPLFGIEQLKDNSIVFIHEGAKAARSVQRMIDPGALNTDKQKLENHPWGEELKHAAHVGWIGGATNPTQTDWGILNRLGFKRAYIVADNDDQGKQAISIISKQLQMITFSIEFNEEFKQGFDLADDFPEKMFSNSIDGIPRYIGPSLQDCLHPSTYMTKQIPNPTGKGKPVTVLREHAKGIWCYIEESDMYVCSLLPEIIRSESVLNRMLSSFSQVQNTCALINKAYQGRNVHICYRPDHKELFINYKNTSAINVHAPSRIKPTKGDPKPFIDFLYYMFPNEEECKSIQKWLATLIARPDIRMEYGLLLVSEAQGVGKTTLCEEVLEPILGKRNVGWPRENDIVNSQFNDWIAHKRLAVISEIYASSSWKAYHTLKGLITDREITVNKKFEKPYVVENWCHIIACSNTHRALKMEADDRRWFYPQITEIKWPREKFKYLREWLKSGGTSIVYNWALNFNDYVLPGERAPMSINKRNAIEGSRSEAQKEAAEIAEALLGFGKSAALTMKDIISAIRNNVQGRVSDTDYEIRRTMQDVGCKSYPDRIKIMGRLQYVIMNLEMQEEIKQKGEVNNDFIRSRIIRVSDIIPTEL